MWSQGRHFVSDCVTVINGFTINTTGEYLILNICTTRLNAEVYHLSVVLRSAPALCVFVAAYIVLVWTVAGFRFPVSEALKPSVIASRAVLGRAQPSMKYKSEGCFLQFKARRSRKLTFHVSLSVCRLRRAELVFRVSCVTLWRAA